MELEEKLLVGKLLYQNIEKNCLILKSLNQEIL